MMVNVKSVGMVVSDMERSLDFYTTVLFFKKISDCEVTGIECDRSYGLSDARVRIAKLQLGDEIIELTEFLNSPGRPIPSDSQSNDLWFQHIAIAVRDIEKVYTHLQHFSLAQTSPCPQTLPEWNPVAGGIQAFYFEDPDGHNLELIYFPDSNSKWQSSINTSDEPVGSEESLFLGIDHTAIVVSDTATSRNFYGDRLGMNLEQECLNWGIEQERLSGIEGVEVRISSFKSSGMGIELLEYLKPHNGRIIPIDTRVNDLWSWHIAIATDMNLGSDSNQDFLPDPDGHKIRLFSVQ